MPLFATFLHAPYRDATGQRGTIEQATFRDAKSTSDAVTQTMARLAETRPGREWGQPLAVSTEVPAWQLREAQQPGKTLYMVGITTSSDLVARVVVAPDRDTAVRQAADDVRRQHPHERQISTLSIEASRDVVDRAIQQWDRQQQPQAITPKQSHGTLDVKDFSQKVIDTYQRNISTMADNSKARYDAIYAHAQGAADDKRATLRDAARVATAAIERYEQTRRQGYGHPSARDQTSQAMAQRYDSAGRDTQRQARQQSYEMSR